MRRLLAFVGGILSGSAIGTAIALLFAPSSERSIPARLRARYQRAVQAGQLVAAQRRAELEAQLAALTRREGER